MISSGPLPVDLHARLLTAEHSTFRAWGVRAAGNMERIDASLHPMIAAMAADPATEVWLQVAIAVAKI